MIQVVDTGCGMSAETRQRVFEPFYTTKEVGKGTGLGLANVHGVVHQHGGAAEVESQLGKGTTFTIHLPTVDSPFAGEAAQDRPAVSGGAEIVLVAEDEELVRNLAQRILEQAGYTVLAATDGAEALQLFRQNRAAIRLVLLDAAMPNLSGCEVFAQIRAESPETKILLASGYARETVLADMEPGAELHFIAKPVDMATLLRTVREAIEEGRTRPVAG
jgi:CheY-like chemotaxis protein